MYTRRVECTLPDTQLRNKLIVNTFNVEVRVQTGSTGASFLEALEC